MSPGGRVGPEQKARERIDAQLQSAGWQVQDRADANLAAGRGVAIREFRMAPDHGFADYLLFLDGKAVGALEAKPEGYPLASVEPQVRQYSEGLPRELLAPHRPLPFLYLSTGTETRFANLLDPEPRTRPVFAAHRPETLSEWLQTETLEQWLAARVGGGLAAELEEMVFDGEVWATDGCTVEPDGWCEHGHSSWLLALHLI